ncbi:MAG: transcription-repair coupling factor [Candidatus Hydrogenedentes bacterium]|nr:transcription-repair coupling factor [Candidatus Hydrogenedentota bacterium]
MAVHVPQLDVIQAIAHQAASGVLPDSDSPAPAIEVVGAWGSAKSLIAIQVADALERPLLLVTPNRIESEAAFEDALTFAGEARCALFPAWEVLPTDAMAPSDDIVAERMNTLMRLAAAAESGERLVVVAPARALLQHVPQPTGLAEGTLSLSVGEEHDLEDLIRRLAESGYERELMVEQRGHMSVRGGIFDIFPISSELPCRIEFFGDEIESIRRFEPETQRSVDHIDTITIPPRSEKRLLAKDAHRDGPAASLTDYLPDNALVAVDEPAAVVDEAFKVTEQFADEPAFMAWNDLHARLNRFTRLSLAQVAYTGARNAPRFSVVTGSMTSWQGHADDFWDRLQRWDADGYTVVILAANSGERRRLKELVEEHGYRPGHDPFDLRIEIGRLRAGFSSPQDRLAILSEREIFGRHYVRRTRRRFEASAAITTFSDLKAGDFVVHIHHGIGRYLGLKRFAGKAGDFLAIQYSGGDKLYVPVTSIDAVQKYVGGDGALPKIDKLGGATWARTKSRVKKAVRDMTEELLRLYAARESQEGRAFSDDTPWQAEFEESFEYDETPDQARAIVDVKGDMQSPRPMDRLVCGDVGYGKTEVALRAAFKAVVGNTQVALLCPTTVLAEQHYLTFSERLADYPVTVEMLSRFRSPAEQKRTVERLKSGEVDIVIGTHRLVSKDIQFKNLGLVIIDEEQRFGVAQKERLKHLRATVDVLTMTATPIPRTLNLALLGARDMSVINTAPNDRLPVHTCIHHFDERLIEEAIRRELARQGQVFFVHNRVRTILPFADLVSKLVPGVRLGVAHGQMPEGELERIMTRFIHGAIDVLVCTNIIGSGLDIPNANTIIINNADHFGLAELYQLRGRVGRYKHRAFAYLLVSGDRALTEDAQKRLKALEEFSTLGSGFRIAMRDLEIRGCGNLLGGEQHGHIAAVGYETYTQLLMDAVAELKGAPAKRRLLPPCEIAIDAFIPGEYVPSEAQKITLYKRMTAANSIEDVEEMQDEIRDRFGAPPRPVQRLLAVMRTRALGADAGASRIVAGKGGVTVEFDTGHALTRQNRNTLAQEFGDLLEFAWQDTPSATLRVSSESPEDMLKAAQHLLTAIADL